ncbi:MAG: hypothetical protein H0X05_06280 [Actinobacteria bacterium]|nr:hypothetical protein [Actinomycetota bacterium]
MVTVAGATVVLERAPATDRIIHVSDLAAVEPSAVLAGLLARAITADRQLFCFTTEPAWATAGAALGLDAGVGSITVLPDGAVPDAPWVVQGGDRM